MGPGELPPEVLAALASASGVGSQNMQLPDPGQHVDIDLTLDDDLQVPVDLLNSGDSADKPIELDIESDIIMSDLQVPPGIFGEQQTDQEQSRLPEDTDMEHLFGPDTAEMHAAGNSNDSGGGVDMSMLLSDNHGDDLFAALNAKDGGNDGGSLDRQTDTDAVQGDRNGGTENFDYSFIFSDDATNQMVEHLLKMGNTVAGSGTAEPGENAGSNPPDTT